MNILNSGNSVKGSVSSYARPEVTSKNNGILLMSLYSKILTKHRFACLMVDPATASFGPFDALSREGSQSSAIYGCIGNRK